MLTPSLSLNKIYDRHYNDRFLTPTATCVRKFIGCIHQPKSPTTRPRHQQLSTQH